MTHTDHMEAIYNILTDLGYDHVVARDYCMGLTSDNIVYSYKKILELWETKTTSRGAYHG